MDSVVGLQRLDEVLRLPNGRPMEEPSPARRVVIANGVRPFADSANLRQYRNVVEDKQNRLNGIVLKGLKAMFFGCALIENNYSLSYRLEALKIAKNAVKIGNKSSKNSNKTGTIAKNVTKNRHLNAIKLIENIFKII